MGDFEKRFRFTNIQCAIRPEITVDDFMNAARARAHHDDLGRKKNGFRDRVGYKDDSLLRCGPELEKLFVEVIANDLIQCAERLVHQQHIRIE